MIFVFRFLQIILLLLILAITGMVVVSWLKTSTVEWGPFLGTLGLFGAMAILLEAVIGSRKKREQQKEKYTQEHIQSIDRLEFKLSKSRGVISFILLLLIIFPLMFFGAVENSPLIQKISSALKLEEDQWLAFWGFEILCLMFFLYATKHLYVLYVANADKPYLSIDETGIFSPLTGKIAWQDISGIRLIERTVQYSTHSYLRVLFNTPDKSGKHKDIALNIISEQEPDIIFAVAKRLHEKYTHASAVPAEFRQQLDDVDAQIQQGAELMEQAVSGSADYFRGMKMVEQGLWQMGDLGDGLINTPQKRIWDRTLKALLAREKRLKKKLADAKSKWIAHLSLLETRAVEMQKVDMDWFHRNMKKSSDYTSRIDAQIAQTCELINQRMKRLLRYKQMVAYAFGLLLLVGMVYLQIKSN